MSTGSAARQALLVVLVIAVLATIAPWFAPYDPNRLIEDGARVATAPSAEHWLGTDALSRDVLSRMLHGARISLGIAFLAVGLALSLGTLIGAAAAMGARWLDLVLMRGTDALLAFPRILLLLLLVASVGRVSSLTLGVMIGLTGWMTTARLIRQETRRLLETEHLKAAVAVGLRRRQILVHHLLPGLAPTLVAAGTIALAAAIPLEAALSFLGLGVPTPQASWGNIITDAQGQLLRRWWLVVFPTLAIVGTVAVLNVAAERLVARRRAPLA